jgi:DNA-binding LytR/AlgR family response regulator
LHLPADTFYKVHRSFAIQTDLIDSIETHDVIVAGMKVPVSHTYRDGLFALLGIPLI